MSDAAAESAPAAAPTTPKKGGKGKDPKAKKPKSKPNHPPTSDMVTAAVKNLKERGGSSLQAIKKYISATYKVDAEKLAPFIRKYLKSAVTSGALVQTKGKGASGSFRLPSGEKAEKKAKAPKSAAAKAPKKPKSPKAKKPAAKKAASPKKAKAAPKPKAPKSPSKAKKSAKAPTKKPKAPKPKKAAKAKSPKKAAPKKK